MVKFVANKEETGALVKGLTLENVDKSGAFPDVIAWNRPAGAGEIVFYGVGPTFAGSAFILSEQTASVDINRETDEIAVLIAQYEDGFTAYPLDIDGVVSQGSSMAEALDNVKEAISLHLEAFGKNVLHPKSDRPIKVFLAKTRLPE